MNDKDKIIEEDLEEDEERRRPPLIFLILLTTFAVLVALGLSFSAIGYLESNETINTIISTIKGDDDKDKDAYIITYAENTGPYKGGINLVNQFPIPDSKGKLFTGENYVYNFSLIVGEKTVGAYYELTAVPDRSNTLSPKYVKLYLEKNGEGVSMSYKNNGKVKVFSDYASSEYKETEGKLIYKGYITKEDVKRGKIEFVMRMWVSEDAVVDNNFGNKTFAVKVNTYARSQKN